MFHTGWSNVSMRMSTGWHWVIGCLILIAHFPQKSSKMSDSFAERHAQRKASYASSPPCIARRRTDHFWGCVMSNMGKSLLSRENECGKVRWVSFIRMRHVPHGLEAGVTWGWVLWGVGMIIYTNVSRPVWVGVMCHMGMRVARCRNDDW